jgi:hypothetical protein
MFLLINKKFDTVTTYETLDEIAEVLGVKRDDISWGVKRTGRWDSENTKFVVIADLPDPEE